MPHPSPRTVSVPLPDGHLAGTLDIDGPHEAAVLYVHGFGSVRGGEKAAALHAACRARGLGFAAFDFRGHGDSSGAMRDLLASGLLADLGAVADYLRTQGVTRLLPVGSSMGGFAAAWFARERPELVPALVLIAPAFRFLEARWLALSGAEREAWRQAGTRRFVNEYVDVELSYALAEERERFRWQDLADGWRVPALIFHGMRDASVPYAHSVELADRAACADIELRLLRGGDHRLSAYKDQLADEACRFFASSLES
jgi:pimeloyl-ACP methyl ester carboxylesterase